MFTVNVSRAGFGTLDVAITARGETVPNGMREVNNGIVAVSFTPLTSDVHLITLKYNCEMVPGKYILLC